MEKQKAIRVTKKKFLANQFLTESKMVPMQ